MGHRQLARSCSTHLGKGDAGLRELDTGYRVPRQILDFANGLLGHIAPGLTPARSLRQDAGSLVITEATAADAARRAGRRVRRRA